MTGDLVLYICIFEIGRTKYLAALNHFTLSDPWPFLSGSHGSVCHGSVLQGQFEGTIHTGNDIYHVESIQRYTSTKTDHHSIIYHENDLGKTRIHFPLFLIARLFRKSLLNTYFQASVGLLQLLSRVSGLKKHMLKSSKWIMAAFAGQLAMMRTYIYIYLYTNVYMYRYTTSAT